MKECCVNPVSRQDGKMRVSAAVAVVTAVAVEKVCNKQQNNEKFNLTTEICIAAHTEEILCEGTIEVDAKKQNKMFCRIDTYEFTYSVSPKFVPSFRELAGTVLLSGIRKSVTCQIRCCAATCRFFTTSHFDSQLLPYSEYTNMLL